MKFSVAAIAALLLPTAELCAGAAEPAADRKSPSQLSTREAVEALSDADLARFLPLLKENYIEAEKLTETEVSRATVQGLLERLGPGAAILQASAAATGEPGPFRTEALEGPVGYVRLGSITAANIAELDKALESYASNSAVAIVLDLRATPAGSEFEQAAEICKRFCPKGRLLFTIKKPSTKEEMLLTSKDDPRWRGLLVVLVDRDTAGAAEVVAAVLRVHARAMIIGQKTRGEAAEFAELPLPSGKLLRVAVGEVALPERIPVFPGGVKPDLPVEVAQETTDAVLKIGLEKGVAELVIEVERPRMNEAALVAGINPEIEAMQAAQRARLEKSKTPPLRDTVLQRALDFITTISIYEKKPGAK